MLICSFAENSFQTFYFFIFLFLFYFIILPFDESLSIIFTWCRDVLASLRCGLRHLGRKTCGSPCTQHLKKTDYYFTSLSFSPCTNISSDQYHIPILVHQVGMIKTTTDEIEEIITWSVCCHVSTAISAASL